MMIKMIIFVLLFTMSNALAITYQVTSVNDEEPNGCQIQSCTLREALIAANQNPGEDTIVLDDVSYFIYRTGSDEDLALSGDLDVLDDLRIIGKFTATEPLDVLTLLKATQINESVFEVHEGVSLYLQQVAVKNSDVGNASGGVIKTTDATVTLDEVIFSQNKARNGGVIFSLFSDIVINNSVFDNNIASNDGGAIFMAGGRLQIHHSYLILNQALASGGAIHASFLTHQNQPTISLDRTFVIENYAEDLGGGLFISGTENTAADVLINRSLFQSNEAQYGGGIRQEGSIDTDIKASFFYNNRVAFHSNLQLALGGAIMLTNGATPFRPAISLSHSAFIENKAENDAGAILTSSGDVNLLNVTFSDNQAENYSTLVSYNSTVNLNHVTITGNDAYNDLDILINDDSELVLFNSLLLGQCALSQGDTTSLGGNIESPGNTCGVGSGINDRVNVSPAFLVEPTVGFHGGPTPTHALGSASLAIDNGLPSNTTATDQRYMTRGTVPDTGAFERQAFEQDLIYKNSYEF